MLSQEQVFVGAYLHRGRLIGNSDMALPQLDDAHGGIAEHGTVEPQGNDVGDGDCFDDAFDPKVGKMASWMHDTRAEQVEKFLEAFFVRDRHAGYTAFNVGDMLDAASRMPKCVTFCEGDAFVGQAPK